LNRLVIVSNRVALPGEGAQRSGGLVTGLVDALHQAGGLWFGWSGKLGEMTPEPNVFETEGVTYATVDLTRAEHDGYYSGFSNAALWPLFHYRLDLMNFTRRDLAAYRRVNALLADALAPLLRPSDLVWVHRCIRSRQSRSSTGLPQSADKELLRNHLPGGNDPRVTGPLVSASWSR
jgi:trehalose 6-phosphate synthase